MLHVVQYPIEGDTELLPNQWAEPEESLCERLSCSDVSAWEALYPQHRQLIRGVLAGQLGYSTDLEDITQQVFETALTLVETGKVKLAFPVTGPSFSG